MPFFQDLPKALRWLRLRSDLQQQQVARAAGITPSMLSSFEQGKRQPSLQSLDRLLDGLGVDLHDLAEALRRVRDEPGEAPPRTVSGAGEVAAGDRRPPAREPAEGGRSRAALDLRQVLGGEDLSPGEEEALGRLLEGFLHWLRVVRAETR